jgi:hypothetical protein
MSGYSDCWLRRHGAARLLGQVFAFGLQLIEGSSPIEGEDTIRD